MMAMMTASETLRARVDRATAKRVVAWAKAHDTDVSGTIRLALERLLAADERARQLDEMRRRLKEDVAMGLFDPPKDDSWKVGGFR